MNKKIIIAFGISVFVGLGYIAYRRTDFGKTIKAKSMIKRITEDIEERNMKWKFPEELLEKTKEELIKFSFSQLEVIEKYVKIRLKRVSMEEIKDYQTLMKTKEIDNIKDLQNLEDMLFNSFGLSNGYRRS